ncbi:BadF/BadG/BcrA/BcrD ATPase family protein [Hoeflea sp. TYP-13]|uniref:BadF/BadG/BcrA/BcrD ATPase family protein n=1 Tax=Hoeflea sp. TYP-13 TaxID=3230023 RepID=UPI0034C60364
MTEFFIGIDGGGTSCRAALASADGTVLGRGGSGAANILTDLDGGVRHIVEAARAACVDAGVGNDALSSCNVLLGLAGANVEATVGAVMGRLPFRRCAVESDALIAVHGALGDQDGAVAILGTGSVFATKTGGVVRTIGGWGFVVGDQGSGAVLGRSLMQEALLAYDGVRPGTAATDLVLRDFDNDPQKLVAFAHGSLPGAFARYAPAVFRLAGEGDAVAIRLVESAARQIDESLDTVLQGPNPKLCLLGGLGALYETWLKPEHRECVVPPEGDALEGASRLALMRFAAGGDANE